MYLINNNEFMALFNACIRAIMLVETFREYLWNYVTRGVPMKIYP